MAKRKSKHLKIDEGILNDFEKIANRKKQSYSDEVEDMMKQYIARDGQMAFDELFAPYIAHMIKSAVDEQINRLAKMIYKTQVESTASLYSSPLMHNQILKGVEEILESFLDPRLLNQNRIGISQEYSLSKNGKSAVQYLRKLAYTDHQEQKKEEKAR